MKKTDTAKLPVGRSPLRFRPEREGNVTPSLQRALAECRRTGAPGLHFPPGDYHFHAEGAGRRHFRVANHDSGARNIIFDLRDWDDFAVTGEDARFIFHGAVNPFVITGCRRLRLAGFRIDWERSFVSRAVVEVARDGMVDLQLAPDDPYRIRDGRWIFFDDPEDEARSYLNIMEYDTENGEPKGDAVDCYVANRVEELAPGLVRISGMETLPRTGSTVVIKHEKRRHPAIFLDHCRDVRLEGVTIHHSCGMGVIGQHCEDVRLGGVQVTPAPHGSRLISTSDDAVHFVNCRGHIVIEECLFENQWDDAVNIHGIYRRLRRRGVGTPFFFLEAGHYQQMGIEMAVPGETLEIVDRQTLSTYHEIKVKSVMPLTPQITRVEFAGELPDRFRDGDLVANLDWTPSVTVRRCIIRRNKPRGVLVTTPRSVLIQDNTFHTAGAAIYISGDGGFWFESGAVRDVLIRNNIFDRCNYMAAATGRAVIDIAPEIDPASGGPAYHRNIRIENNRFYGPRCGADDLVRADSVDDLLVRDNEASDHCLKPS